MSELSSVAKPTVRNDRGFPSSAVGVLALGVVGSTGLNSILFAYETPDAFWQTIGSVTVLQSFLAIPLLVLAALKIRQLTSLNRRLHDLAMQDELTGLLNRRAFTQKCKHRLSRQSGFLDETPTALLLIDVDFFKSINDDYGHTSGDDVLKGIAKALSDAVRSEDYVGRLGGEEFAILLMDVDRETTKRTAERVRRHVEEMVLFAGDGRMIRTSISIGCACVGDADDFSTIYRDADRRLYRAKANGRNRVMMETSAGARVPNFAVSA